MQYSMELKNQEKTKNRRAKATAGSIILYIVLILLAVVCFMPFYLMIINATHSNGEIASGLKLLPGHDFFENYRRMRIGTNIWQGFLNSGIIAVSATALSGYFGAMTAYGFAKFKFKGSKVLFWVVLSSMMIPGQLALIGLFQLCTTLHLLDNFLALIIPAIANANTVFFVKLYIDSAISSSLIESARIDGCGEIKIFNRIVLPLIVPSIATMSILTFVTTWNNYLTPLTLLMSNEKFTLPIMVALSKGVYQTDYGAQYVCIALSVIPIMIVFAFCSKYIIGGLTVGSVKG